MAGREDAATLNPATATTLPGDTKERWYRVSAYRLTAVLAAVFVIAGTGLLYTEATATYPIQQAMDRNLKAEDAQSLQGVAAYLNESIAILSPFHGDPCWITPTPYTDMDEIRSELVGLRDTAIQKAGTDLSWLYLENVQMAIGGINGRLDLAKGWYVRSPVAIALFVVYAYVSAVAADSYVTAVVVRDKNLRKPGGILFGLVWLAGTIAMVALLATAP